MAVAFGILGLLAAGVWLVGRSSPPNPVAAATAPPPPETSAPPTPTASTVLANTFPTVTNATRPSATTTTLTPSDEIVLPGDVFAHTQAALTAWGVFAATGQLEAVERTFVLDGPQYESLAIEAETWVAPPGDPSLVEFLLTFPEVISSVGEQIAVVRATIVVAQDGEVSGERNWDVEMHWAPGEGRWRLFKATESPAE